jgi:hypothetical protein
MERDPRTAGPEWVADGDGAPIHVGALSVQAELLLDCKVLGGERLVHLNEIHIVEFQAGTGERLPGGWSRSNSHDARIDAYAGPGEQAAQGTEATLGREPSTGKQEGCRAIANAGCIPGGHDSVLLEVRG